MINPIVLSVTPLSLDHTQDLGVISLIGASLSVMMAGIPFKGPVGAVRVGRVDGQFVINPTLEQIANGDMNLICAGYKGTINMIECDAKQVPDEIVNQAFELAQQKIDEMCDMQSKYLTQFTITPREVAFNKPSESVMNFVKAALSDEIKNNMIGNTKVNFNNEYKLFEIHCLDLAKEQITEENKADFSEAKIKLAVFDVVKYVIRNRTLDQGLRVDDRGMNDIRPLFTQVDTIPRVHGAGLFRR